MNHFTLSAVKSKRIELRNSACWHLIAFLQSFLMVTDFHMFLKISCPQFKKTWRTLILSKIVTCKSQFKTRNFTFFFPSPRVRAQKTHRPLRLRLRPSLHVPRTRFYASCNSLRRSFTFSRLPVRLEEEDCPRRRCRLPWPC